MKAALGALTTRGRVFLTAGVTAAVLALLFGQRDILRVGLLISALPLLSALSVSRTRFRLSCTRRLEPSRIAAGHEATALLHLENVSALPTGLLLVEDRVPVSLGTRPRFVVDRLGPHTAREVSYVLRSDVRGRFLIGPLVLRVTDPFGLCSLERAFSQRDTLVVTPQVQPLPTITLSGDWAGQGDSRARSVAAAGDDDVAVRDYRRGDELRRVHWPSTARHGALMVRREEQPWESRCSVLLDTRPCAHRGRGHDSSFERAISVAASVGVHLGRRGFEVRLVGPAGTEVASAAHQPGTQGSDTEGLLLDALAVVEPAASDSAEGLITAARHHGDALMVAVVGHLTPDDVDRFVHARHATGASVAIVLDVADWLPTGDATAVRLRRDLEQATTLMRNAGWRIVRLGRRDAISDVWPQVGIRHLAGAANQAAYRTGDAASPSVAGDPLVEAAS